MSMSDLSYSRTFLRHVDAAHRRLDRLITEVEESLRSWSRGAGGEGVAMQFETLRRELAEHFSEEEQGGSLEEAACRCPSLGPWQANLQRQHAALLAQVDQVVDAVGKGVDRERIASLFAECAGALRAHESEENQLLAQAFGTNWAADDEPASAGGG
jgi:hemerythrin